MRNCTLARATIFGQDDPVTRALCEHPVAVAFLLAMIVLTLALCCCTKRKYVRLGPR
jgi:hypothetical protein